MTDAETEGMKAQFQFAVVEANEPIVSHTPQGDENPSYPKVYQPRLRDTVAYRMSTESRARRLKPTWLGEDPRGTGGSPMVGPDLLVEAGNGRMNSIRLAYSQDMPTGVAYKTWLADHAADYGLDPAVIRSMNQPVLVRIRRSEFTPEQRVQWTRELNLATEDVPGATEVAMRDAERLTPDLMNLFVPSNTGILDTAENREFIRGFLGKLSPAERGPFIGVGDQLSPRGADRIRAAIFAKVYGDRGAIERLLDDPDDNVRNITRALTNAAPQFFGLKNLIASGDAYDVDLSPDIVAAMNKLSGLRRSGANVEDYLRNLELVPDLTPLQKNLIEVFNQANRSVPKMTALLRNYVEAANEAGSPKQVGMFGGTRAPTKDELFTVAVRMMEETHGALGAEVRPGLQPGRGPTPAGPLAAEPIPAAGAPARGAPAPEGAGRTPTPGAPIGPPPTPAPPVSEAPPLPGPAEIEEGAGGVAGGEPQPAAEPIPARARGPEQRAQRIAGVGGLPPEFVPPDEQAAAAARGRRVPRAPGRRPPVPPPPGTGSPGPLGLRAMMERKVRPLAQDLQRLYNAIFPSEAGEAAHATALSLRDHAAKMDRLVKGVNRELEKIDRDIPRRSVDRQAFDQFIIETESNLPSTTPAFQKHGETIRLINDVIRREVDVSDPETIRQWRAIYWPNAWVETLQQQAPGREAPTPTGMGRRPLAGSKAFTRAKTFPTYQEGLDAGLTPAFDTVGDYWKWKTREMAKFAMAKRIFNEEKAIGHRIFVGLKRPPEGYGFINDPMGTVFGRPTITISEAFDKKVREGLDAVMQSLGIPSEREPAIGGRRAGYYDQAAGMVVTRFGGPESVIEHEIGHALDERYKLWDVLTAHPGTDKEAIATRKKLQEEMRRLAAMRIEGEDVTESHRRYIMSRPEKVANALAALMYAPDLLEVNAPTIKGRLETFLREHNELRPLLDIKPSLVLGTTKAEVPVGGIVIHGKWAFPEGSARIINNYTSPGLREPVPLFNTFANLGNLMVRLKLTGAYHFGVTAFNSIYSKLHCR
jgi:hypothetical protein